MAASFEIMPKYSHAASISYQIKKEIMSQIMQEKCIFRDDDVIHDVTGWLQSVPLYVHI